MCRWTICVQLIYPSYSICLGYRLPRLLFQEQANTTLQPSTSNDPETVPATSITKQTQKITTKHLLTTPKTLPVVTSHTAKTYSTGLSPTALSHTTTTSPTTISTTASTTTHPTTTRVATLSICDYLCSIQMGGAACSCSVPLVPGRK